MTNTTTDAAEARALTPEVVAAAIKATEYKYFGDYEFSDDQREAVDVLVEVARHRLATAEAASGAGEAAAFKRGAEAMQRALADALRDHLNSRAAAIANGIEIPEYRP